MYLLSVLPDGFKELKLATGESYAKHDCLLWIGKPKQSTWKTPPLEWLEDDFTSNADPIPDITSVAGTIALSQKAYDLLKDLIGEHVEFLSTVGPTSDESWTLINVTNVQNLLDPSKSRYEIEDDGEVGLCEHGFLNAPEEGNHIFQVADYSPYIFIDEQTKQVIESAGLTGALIREYLNP